MKKVLIPLVVVLVVLGLSLSIAGQVGAQGPTQFHGATIQKTVLGPGGFYKAHEGDTVTATIRVINTDDFGDALTINSITDVVHHASGDVATGNLLGAPVVLVNYGDFVDVSHSYVVEVGDNDPLTDTAATTGNDPVVGDFTLTFPGIIDIINPCIEVTKTVSPDISKAGDEVTYTICVYNCGDVDLENVVVDDSILGILSFPSELPVGEEVCLDFPYVIPDDAPCDGSLENTVTASGEDFTGYSVSDDDSATVEIVCPGIDVTKTVSPDVYKAGDEVIYTICVINTGDVEMEFDLNDSIMGPLGGDSVLPGDQGCAVFPYVIPDDAPCDGSLVNTVTVTASPVGLDNIYTAEASAEVEIVCPCIDVTKTVTPTEACYGDEVTYTICVSNCGDVEMDFAVDDSILGPLGVGSLLPGDQSCADFPYIIPDGDFDLLVNTVTVTASPVGLDNIYTAEASAEVVIDCPGEQGCTPGFWKVQPKFDPPHCWECFVPTDLVGDVFAIPGELSDLADDTLNEALSYKGGGGVEGAARNLLRHGVAALLNACDPDVAYPMSVGQVISSVNAALATLDRGEILGLKDMLDEYNNLGCSIDNHCNPIPVPTPAPV